MYLTEVEAKSHICPHITYDWVDVDGMSGNKTVRSANASCYGSSCMAWRWAGGLPTTEKGYCGLAGRPGPFEKDNQ